MLSLAHEGAPSTSAVLRCATLLELAALTAARTPVVAAETQHFTTRVARLEAQLGVEVKEKTTPAGAIDQLATAQGCLADVHARTDALTATACIPLLRVYEPDAYEAVRGAITVFSVELVEFADAQANW
eukprot:gnl/Chilomastix_cuspidata/6933.p3 GENE.gnl/Chilomastix_cuspidata/6933~~gnl/Chilomastix_cuspidata/6933.p3  ORF type:complete len:129 (-),score=8.46 gnl/Chilomastix_cuspidata/6933:344-730(-)